ncbi:cbb3-type cytochrome c oxidase N-terminal domain-containing protein [Cerasicoccus fimbriatus]|uniref:cbb3-type cytochrome c oxidase N-terminal domain-containing protein n=1 Tax=Cerasicoccus fimbriatus TaxID=3014554 RepID=UPI0022B343F8|nr:cbb3-type cytochrome c oxidase N-terminal domain-containing protein [Cerasicoccus sp. TK19100]
MSDVKPEDLPEGVILKDHTYDGIQEYDQRLPRWWLLTLYGAIIFAGGYFMFSQYYSGSQSNQERVESEMKKIDAIRLANSIDVTNNEMFWDMSKNPSFVLAGEKTFQSTCSPCHGANLQGGIGFNLVDGEWVHGAAPSSIYNTIYNGVPDKGMQAWGTMLGQKRIAEVVAYVLSKNDEATLRAAAESEGS